MEAALWRQPFGGSREEAVGLSTIELTRFRVRPENTSALLAARPRMLDEFRADRSGFIDARLVRLPDGQWLDIVSWRSPEDFAASRAKGANLPSIRRSGWTACGRLPRTGRQSSPARRDAGRWPRWG